ncbi:MAG: aminotransferase class [Rhodoglobus sp.]|jgi:glutamate-1-semialdehyde 2,1-aminomutase|nr:aminotransferase class [Rhodoglobus sp.]
MGTERYTRSLEYLATAEKVIPLGTQTYSKSRKTFPPGLAPLYATKARGSHIWDVDGNEYVDLMSALASVNLGYADPEINAAVAAQLENGTTISLTHPIEAEVAQLIIDLVPSAEKVRFGKNGSDATTAAIRIARGFTGHDDVITCGYHGWQDWYIGVFPSRNLGVPRAYSDLIHPVPFNDLAAMEAELKARPTAAVILEPMTTDWPAEGYLEGVRELATKYGAVLVFDEMVTGFRFANGGAQEYFGVTPDLSTFGKGVANGYPLSAIVGRADLMTVLETAFFSGTFGGELLSLTAARVVLERIKSTDVIQQLAVKGEALRGRVQAEIVKAGVEDLLTLPGHPAWVFTIWNAGAPGIAEIKQLFMQEMSRNGVLMIASHNVMAAHTEADLDAVVAAYATVLPIIREAADKGDAASRLDAEVTGLGQSVR